ncbi:hypothetical protein, partial [Mesorhizobium sp.]|uniref:hypothetical protein n=1 Tax=Mesorhizobium sp. TaxID=1871066 RepID=UPI00345C4C36
MCRLIHACNCEFHLDELTPDLEIALADFGAADLAAGFAATLAAAAVFGGGVAFSSFASFLAFSTGSFAFACFFGLVSTGASTGFG